MSGVFCVLIFALLFAIVVVNTTSTSLNNEANSSRLGSRADNTTCRVLSGCELYCFMTINFIEAAEAAVAAAAVCDEYYLRIDKVNLTSKLSPGWFNISVSIFKIYMKDDGSLTDIEPNAFNDCQFKKLTELEIRSTGVSILKRGVFNGVSSLKTLRLTENLGLQQIEENAMEPLYQLENLKMTNQTQFKNLIIMTGTTQLKYLHTLNLSSNNFSSTINAETFKGCNHVVTLDLSNSSIQTIEMGSFDHMIETIQFLDLRYNQLKYLPSNLLENMIKPDVEFYLSFNLWHCDCDTLQLQWWDVSNSSSIIDSILCETPELENGKDIANADRSTCLPRSSETTPDTITTTCPEYTPTTENTPTTEDIPTTENTSTPDTPTIDITTPTTVRPPNVDRVNCMYEKHLYLEKVYQYFDVRQLEMGKVSVGTNSLDPSLSMVVVNDNEEARCRYDLAKQMIFDNLNPNSVHIFCLVKKNSYSTSPKNCVAFHFNETPSIWGHDEIIIALVCSIVFSLIVGVLIGWLLSCRYNRFFKAKESLEYQSSTTSRKTISEDLSISDYQGGKFSLDGGTNLRRSYSENSIISCKSYITAVTPSPFEIIQWKLRKNAMNSNTYPVRDYLDNLEYDCLPPPLPPYPNRRNSDKIYETIAEPVYTCTSDIVPYRITYASPT